ncbi:ASKHA domain-containing protein [Desulfatiferula olefinivorans]
MTDSPHPKHWVLTVDVTAPDLSDNTADAERLAAALKPLLKAPYTHMDLAVLRKIPRILRAARYRVTCLVFQDRDRWILVDLKAADDPAPFLGLAVDLGTTRVVFRLIDLERGERLGESSFDNPQIAVGPDILARIHYADRQGGLDHIQGLIIEAFNREIAALSEQAGVSPQSIGLLAVAGNTAMTHLFLGITPHFIIREPYIPGVNRPGLHRAADLGLAVNQNARVFVFPNIGSYFGGDLIAGILFSGLNESEELSILVDVGTNAEVVLGNKDFLIACAGAAGPALEGGVSTIGMMAGPGVIDTVSLDEQGGLVVHTIGDKPPIGICGSGFIDLAAMLFSSGAMDIRGRIVPERLGDRLRVIDEMNHVVLVPKEQSGTGEDICISQAGLDSLIRSKAAMYTILETIAMNVGLTLNDLAVFYVAGTFGSFINPRSAITIGMIPDLPLSTYRTLGNSSLGGASMILESPDALARVDTIRDAVTYIELNVDQGFMNRFSGAKFIPHTHPELFPSVRIPGRENGFVQSRV